MQPVATWTACESRSNDNGLWVARSTHSVYDSIEDCYQYNLPWLTKGECTGLGSNKFYLDTMTRQLRQTSSLRRVGKAVDFYLHGGGMLQQNWVGFIISLHERLNSAMCQV